MNPQAINPSSSAFYRFQVVLGNESSAGFEKTKTIGMAYLKEGQSTYTLRLWTLLNDRFYVIPSKHDPAKYLVMTREPNKNPNGKNRYFWNIVGNGVALSSLGYIRFEFDLFDKPIYMAIYPESSAQAASLPDFASFDEIAA